MSKGQILKTLVNERLTAAAEEIFALFERTIAEYEEELCRSKKENERKQQLLMHKEDVQIQTEQPQDEWSDEGVKLEEELNQEVTCVVVKSEYEEQNDEENSESPCSSSAQQIETEADGDDYGRSKFTDQPAAAQATNESPGDAANKTNECPVCEMKLGCNQDLHRHLLVHTGEKTYSEKQFGQKSNLKTHAIIHTDAFEDFLHQSQTKENEDDAPEEELRDRDSRASSSSPQIEIEIEDDNQVCQKYLDKATQNSNDRIQPQWPDEVDRDTADLQQILKEVKTEEEDQLQGFSSMYVKSASMCDQRPTEHGGEADLDYQNWIENWEPPASSSYQPVETDDEVEDSGSSFIQSTKVVTKKNNPVEKVGREAEAKTKHECSVCKKKLGRKQELKRHMLLHTGEKPFSCPVCEKRFIQKSNLKSHIVTHLDSVDTFLRHQKPEDTDRGAEINASLDSQHNFTENSSDTDIDDWEPPAGSTPQMDTDQTKRTEAQNSSAFFKSFPEAREDQSTLERTRLLLNQALSESKERGKKAEYHCPICTKIFGRMENLRRHLLIHTGEKPFSCPVCNKCFTLKQHLKLHMVVHTGEKQFNCSVCTKTFNRKDNLRSHMKVHSVDRPFGCSQCGARFNLNKNLMRHMAVHSGQTLYSCTVCNSGFSSQHCLKRHMKIHKKDKPK